MTALAALLALGAAACTGTGPAGPEAGPEVPAHEAITREDPWFAGRFRHGFADVDGVRMHCVTGGSGSPVVLLHGWSQTWYGWWEVMPELAEHHTVHAIDLPGLGDSTGAPSGYDKATLARYAHTLVADRLGVRDAAAVGHDLGAAGAFQYAAQFPQDTARLGYLDLPLFSPQVSFNGTAFGGDATTSPFSEAEIDESRAPTANRGRCRAGSSCTARSARTCGPPSPRRRSTCRPRWALAGGGEPGVRDGRTAGVPGVLAGRTRPHGGAAGAGAVSPGRAPAPPGRTGSRSAGRSPRRTARAPRPPRPRCPTRRPSGTPTPPCR
ncbi:alpha/beta fold hydrolase [Actinosynnema sp.]|uniref:alpha/beta fold hydrolase n=1 Tax=Actinosynnema sp. TaxID=1872144 RepID=UPI003F876FC4